MKTECKVARDLMPLCVDGVASEESTNYIHTHIAECADCKTYFESMNAALPVQTKKTHAQEQTAFTQAAEILRKKHGRRVLRNVLLGILIGALIMIGGYIGWIELAVKYNAELPTDDYGVFLTQLENGKVVVSIDRQGSKRIMGTVIRGGVESDSQHPDGLYTLRIWMETTIIAQTMATAHQNGPTTVINAIDQYDVILIGKHGDEILWQKGDAIPQASAEMETFYMADNLRWDTLLNWHRKINAGGLNEIPQTVEDTLQSMAENVQRLRLAVPEWQ